MIRTMLACLAFSVLILTTGTAHAWDKERKGFVLGFGSGVGFSSLKQSALGLSATEKNFSIPTDLAIGYAPNNRTLIYYAAETSWFKEVNGIGNNVLFFSQLAGVGVRHYVKESAPSFFVNGSLGLGIFDNFESGTDASYGPGFGGGFGFEFRRYWAIQAGVNYISTSQTFSGVDLDSKALSLRVVLSVTGY